MVSEVYGSHLGFAKIAIFTPKMNTPKKHHL